MNYSIGLIVVSVHALLIVGLWIQNQTTPPSLPKNPIVIRTSIPIQKQTPPKRTKTVKTPDPLLQEIAKQLGTIVATPKKCNRPEIPLPKPIEMTNAPSPQPNQYGQHVLATLQNHLELPEVGKVIVKIAINSKGSITSLKILEFQSEKNAQFIKNRLQDLTFPCFNEFGLSASEMDFTITFCNVENR